MAQLRGTTAPPAGSSHQGRRAGVRQGAAGPGAAPGGGGRPKARQQLGAEQNKAVRGSRLFPGPLRAASSPHGAGMCKPAGEGSAGGWGKAEPRAFRTENTSAAKGCRSDPVPAARRVPAQLRIAPPGSTTPGCCVCGWPRPRGVSRQDPRGGGSSDSPEGLGRCGRSTAGAPTQAHLAQEPCRPGQGPAPLPELLQPPALVLRPRWSLPAAPGRPGTGRGASGMGRGGHRGGEGAAGTPQLRSWMLQGPGSVVLTGTWGAACLTPALLPWVLPLPRQVGCGRKLRRSH